MPCPRRKNDKLWHLLELSADSEYRSRAHSCEALIVPQKRLFWAVNS